MIAVIEIASSKKIDDEIIAEKGTINIKEEAFLDPSFMVT